MAALRTSIALLIIGALPWGEALSWALHSELQAEALEIFGSGQGLYLVSEQGEPLVSIQADTPFMPASLSKIPATTALLGHWGPRHRFATRLIFRGTDPSLQGRGDLVIEAAGDPFWVSESVLRVGTALARLGYAQFAGSLELRGSLFLNWRLQGNAQALRQAWARLPTETESAAMREIFTDELETAGTSIVFIGGQFRGAPEKELLTYLSPPLLPMLKELNAYSNNVFHDWTRATVGSGFVQADARARSPHLPPEVLVIENAAGLGTTNRLSPKAAVAQVAALEALLAESGHVLSAVLPVAGLDPGTLSNRLRSGAIRGALVGKTGTIPSRSISAIAGVLRTKTSGRVRFAILNQGLPVAEARLRQDRFLRLVSAHLGSIPLSYEGMGPRALSFAQIR